MQTPDTFCGSCGQPVQDNSPSEEASVRIPCPNCGSLTRRHEFHAHVGAVASGSAELTTKTYPQVLLTTAEDLLASGQFGISVVVAHMACEVAAERTLSESFRTKNIDYLEDTILGSLNGYSLASDRNRKLYLALTGDEIQQQSFWQAFKESATRRNEVMHKSKIVTQNEAQASLIAARALVSHLNK